MADIRNIFDLKYEKKKPSSCKTSEVESVTHMPSPNISGGYRVCLSSSTNDGYKDSNDEITSGYQDNNFPQNGGYKDNHDDQDSFL